MEEDKIILTAADIGVWAYGKFAKQEKAIKCLKRANYNFAAAIICTGIAASLTVQWMKKQELRIEELQAQIDALKHASE